MSEIKSIEISDGKYGICSDLHLGSEYFDDKAFLEYIYYLRNEQISNLFIIGDLFECNDINKNYSTLTEENYIEKVKKTLSMINENKINYYLINGNHEECIKKQYPKLYEKLMELIQKTRGIHYDEKTLQLKSPSNNILLTHIHEDFPQLESNENILYISGHEHFVNLKSKKNIKEFHLTLGGFRKNFQDVLHMSGFIINLKKDNKIFLEQYGELDGNQKLLLGQINHGTENINITNLNNIDLEPNRLEYLNFLNNLHEKIKEIDPNVIFWITGSFARGNLKTEFVNSGILYNAKIDKSNEKNFIINNGVSKNRFLPLSDIDIEIISDDEKITHEKLNKLLLKTISTNKVFNSKIPRIDISKYSNNDLEKYMNIFDSDKDIHNYLLYKILISSKAVLDNDSDKALKKYIHKAMLLLQSQLNTGDLNDVKSYRVSKGYYPHLKEFKQNLKKGNLKLGDGLFFDNNHPLYEYLDINSNNNHEGKSNISMRPADINNNNSFKVIFPKNISFDVIHNENIETKMIAPPISIYENRIHMGQLLNNQVALAITRFENLYKKNNYNMEVSFQSSGPFWGKNNYKNYKDIYNQINKSIETIKNILNNLNIETKDVHHDLELNNIKKLQQLIELLYENGLIYIDEKKKLFLRITSAIKMFGKEEIFQNLKSSSIKNTINYQTKETTLFPLEPKNNSTIGAASISLNNHIYMIYPTIAVLPLHHDQKHQNSEIICGENISTQFAISHAITSHLLDEKRTPEIKESIFKLIKDHDGSRMSRNLGTTIYISEKENKIMVKKQNGNIIFEANQNKPEELIAINYAFMKVFSTSKVLKFDPRAFNEGVKLMKKLLFIKNALIKKSIICENFYYEYNDFESIDTNFIKVFENREIGSAIRLFNLSLNNFIKLEKKHHNNNESISSNELKEKFQNIILMYKILFDDKRLFE